jgi:hypothetical protein
MPDTRRVALHRVLAAECAGVSRMLGDFDLLDLFAEGGTVAGRNVLVLTSLLLAIAAVYEDGGDAPSTVFTGDADLLRGFRHCCGVVWGAMTVCVLVDIAMVKLRFGVANFEWVLAKNDMPWCLNFRLNLAFTSKFSIFSFSLFRETGTILNFGVLTHGMMPFVPCISAL